MNLYTLAGTFLENLRRAVTLNDVESVITLLLKNSKLLNEPELKFEIKLLILKACCQNIDRKIIKYLANFYQSFESGGFGIHLSTNLKSTVTSGNLMEAEILLKNGVKLDIPNHTRSMTVFMRKLFELNNCEEILKLLIQFGLDIVHLRDHRDNSALHIFLHQLTVNDPDNVKIAEILINSGLRIDEADFTGETPLNSCIHKKLINLVIFLISKGADVNKKNQHGDRLFPLILALTTGKSYTMDLIRLLLSKGADINAKTESKWSVLHEACVLRDSEIMHLLIKNGIELSALPKDRPFKNLTPFKLLKYTYSPQSDQDECTREMVKEFSRLSYENCPVYQGDMKLIEADPVARELFVNCTTELKKLGSTKFYLSHSYYSVLKMSNKIKKLSKLVRNEEFVKNFNENLSEFTYYQNDLRMIFDEAIRERNEFEAARSKLKSIFNDFFPDIVIGKLAKSLNAYDSLFNK